jgi:hypothetical protein
MTGLSLFLALFSFYSCCAIAAELNQGTGTGFAKDGREA